MAWYRFDMLESQPLDAVVSTRHGGVSQPPYATLNLGLRVGDDPDRVLANRRRLFDAVGLDLDRSVWCRQIHAGTVTVVDEDDAGRGAFTEDDIVPDTDALVTAVSGLALCVTVADCVPVVIYDPDHHVLGLSHAGWGGTVAHITRRTVEAMSERFGSRPDRLLAGLGPSISPGRYEVGADVVARAEAAFPRAANLILAPLDGGKALFDLWKANSLDLTSAGVPSDQVEVAGLSTLDDDDEFFSARAARKTGRFIAAACLRPL